ncbi:MAG: recombinase zinc beta ribbon domain-containing protein, partial [Acidimicrobiia bacterium]
IKSDWLRHLIKNPIYAGRVRLKGHEYPGQHEAIVSAEAWDRANAAAASALRPARCRLQARDKNCHLLKGLVVCAHCDRAMIPSASGKRDTAGKLYRYYTCGQAHQEGGPCPVRHVSADLLELATVRLIGALLRHPEIVSETLEVTNGRRRGDRRQIGARVTEIDHALGEIDASLQRIVDVIAAPESEVLGEELRARAGTLKTRKQVLLVEREQLRQDLLNRDQPKLDAARLLAAIARFAEIFPTLSQTEQKDLVALCVARIELRSDPARDDRPGRRRFRVRFKLHLDRLAEGMEENIVVNRSAGPGSPAANAPLTLESRLIFQSIGRAPKAIIVAPFNEEFQENRLAAKAGQTPASATGSHPLIRALDWAKRLRADVGLTQAALARQQGVTAATLTYHLKLLKLAPEIQAHVKGLSAPADLRRYSLRRLKALAGLNVTTQRDQFAKMRSGGGSAAQLAAKSVRIR